MRFIAFLECAAEDLDEMISTWNRRMKEGRQVKTLLPPHTMADAPKGVRSFTVFETEDEEEIMKYVTEYGVISKVKIYPIWESSRGAETYRKMKK